MHERRHFNVSRPNINYSAVPSSLAIPKKTHLEKFLTFRNLLPSYMFLSWLDKPLEGDLLAVALVEEVQEVQAEIMLAAELVVALLQVLHQLCGEAFLMS